MDARKTNVSLLLMFMSEANSGVVMLGVPERAANNCGAYAKFLQAKSVVGDNPRHLLLCTYLSLSTDRSMNRPQNPKGFSLEE